MTTLLIIIAIIFAILIFVDAINEYQDYNKWLKKAMEEYDVTPKSFKTFYDYASRGCGNITPAHKAYLMAAEEWYDLNCK